MPFSEDIQRDYETASLVNNHLLKKPRWWFGGICSSTVAIFVAPFDLLKSHMQIQKRKKTIYETARNVLRVRGPIGFYDGFGAAILRQMTSTSLRFSIYEMGKNHNMGDCFYKKVILASFAGIMGALLGIPTDLVNVRMQVDSKWPPEMRRNYKNVFDALVRIPREEGFLSLYNGMNPAILKSVIGTIGQIALYDEIKEILQSYGSAEDDVRLHLKSSLLSSIIACVITQPLDVLKTLHMNSRPGEFRTSYDAIVYMMRFGPTGPFRGLLPSIVRKGPSTVLLFVLYEQLRLQFGYDSETA